MSDRSQRTTVSTVLYWVFGVFLVLYFLMVLGTQAFTLRFLLESDRFSAGNYSFLATSVIAVLAKLAITISYFLRSGAICWVLPFEILSTTAIATLLTLSIPVVFAGLIFLHIIVFVLFAWLLYYLIKRQEIRRP